MRMIFKSAHKSIEGFEPVIVPNFMVLTGLNGSGKSHLLSAIKSGAVILEPLIDPRVVLFTPADFMVDNQSVVSAYEIEQQIEAGWNFLKSDNIKPHLESWENQIKNVRESAELTRDSTGSSFFEALDDTFKKRIKSFFDGTNGRSNEAKSLFIMLQSLPVWIGDLSKSEFSELYKPRDLKNDFLPIQLSRVIWDYYLKFRTNQLNEFCNSKYGKNYPVLSDAEFLEKFGPKPWDLISEILKEFDSLKFRVDSPEGLTDHGNYKLDLIRTDNGSAVEFGSLSSGEKILMAMVASVFKASSDRYFPDVLLLDEVDASLHPSMIKNVLRAIDNVFVSRGIKVILVTHSPTTIALVPEDSIFVASNSDGYKVEKQERGAAISTLTEGFATLDQGIRIFDQVARTKISIVTEGGNAAILSLALELFDVDGVEVIKGIESISGKNQLQTLFKFFSCVAHDNSVVFIWDCDAEKDLPVSMEKNIALVIPRNGGNKLTSSGIENAFPEELFEGLVNETKTSAGDVHKVFDKSRKGEFAARVVSRRSKDDFINFHSLIEEIRALVA